MGDTPRLEQNKTETKITTNGRVALIGLFGGLIWGLVGYLAWVLNFTKVGPGFVLAPFPLGKWKAESLGQLVGVLCVCVLSIIMAFVYKYALGKIKSMWIGIGFGLVLWVIVFYILQPWIPGIQHVTKLGWNTISTTACLFALYGLFVGYSISYDLESYSNSENYSKK
ncbi:membrane protein YqhR [Scopulibacillus darangshiensis]|uniref:Membrane protein YqhR n=1 Tax=Scopulibacillus darangshiensis TaxID=442528 RepID=A0A4R2P870_9BACL|nr:YqhR family membrane protein [Scopulibacillus darangshiensis]TCP31170.1 membrane protein YqhR [Scopulibacillus darangshiensis]